MACSDIPPLREIARSTVHYFDPLSDRQMQDALVKLASGAISAGAAQSERRGRAFTWEKTSARHAGTDLSEKIFQLNFGVGFGCRDT